MEEALTVLKLTTHIIPEAYPHLSGKVLSPRAVEQLRYAVKFLPD